MDAVWDHMVVEICPFPFLRRGGQSFIRFTGRDLGPEWLSASWLLSASFVMGSCEKRGVFLFSFVATGEWHNEMRQWKVRNLNTAKYTPKKNKKRFNCFLYYLILAHIANYTSNSKKAVIICKWSRKLKQGCQKCVGSIRAPCTDLVRSSSYNSAQGVDTNGDRKLCSEADKKKLYLMLHIGPGIICNKSQILQQIDIWNSSWKAA